MWRPEDNLWEGVGSLLPPDGSQGTTLKPSILEAIAFTRGAMPSFKRYLIEETHLTSTPAERAC